VAPGISCWRASSELYFEVDVCEKKGEVYVGFAGANLTAEFVGSDDKSWVTDIMGYPKHK
jgi:hypothetical protein